ncbi:UNVERIFIED_CONTAM: hypothetical protein Scaly_2632000 [Sesamum calycinum]|uniref:Integrase catalytic domain-containing protein n=1 Tax=Sesamum calycinum TaxID=2727403 RepID=A0AAW2JB79_9LAMI
MLPEGLVEGFPLLGHIGGPLLQVNQKEKASFSFARATPGGPSKRTRASSLDTPPQVFLGRHLHHPLLPSLKKRGDPSKHSRTSSNSLYSRQTLEHERKETSSLELTLMRGVVTPKNRLLFAPLPREDLEKSVSLHMMKGTPHTPERSLEAKTRGQGGTPSHEGAPKKVIEKTILDFSHMEEVRHFLEGYWASCIKEFKKFDEYQREVAKIAIAILDYGFKDCKKQFAAQGYAPAGEEPSFLDIGVAMVNDPNPFVNPTTPSSGNFISEFEEDLDSILGEVEEEVRNTPLEAAIDLVVGEVLSEGATILKEGVSFQPSDHEVPPIFYWRYRLDAQGNPRLGEVGMSCTSCGLCADDRMLRRRLGRGAFQTRRLGATLGSCALELNSSAQSWLTRAAPESPPMALFSLVDTLYSRVETLLKAVGDWLEMLDKWDKDHAPMSKVKIPDLKPFGVHSTKRVRELLVGHGNIFPRKTTQIEGLDDVRVQINGKAVMVMLDTGGELAGKAYSRCDVRGIEVGAWTGKCNLMVVPLDDFDVILGVDFMLLAHATDSVRTAEKKYSFMLAMQVKTGVQRCLPPELPKKLPPRRVIDHAIELELGARPPAQAPYHMATAELAELRKQLDGLLEIGLIKPSKVPYDLFDKLNKAKCYMKIDLIGYWQVRVVRGDEQKTMRVTRLLKQAISSQPVLKFPQFDKPFEVQVDASDRALGGEAVPKQASWQEFLGEFDFEGVHRLGKHNDVVDALSKKLDEEYVTALTVIEFDFLDQIQESSKTDAGPFCRCMLRETHDPQWAEHPGIDRMLALLARRYYWPRMDKDVEAYTRTCLVSQLDKVEEKKEAGLSQPLPIPEVPWQSISIDFISGFSKVNGMTSVLVVVDRFSKYGIFIVAPHVYPVETTAELFFINVTKYFCVPQGIISDRDAKFTGRFWTTLFNMMGTELKFSTTNHPQIDGQTERVNALVKDYLRHYMPASQRNWVDLLDVAQFSYNLHKSSATGMSPFELAYGQQPTTPHGYQFRSQVENALRPTGLLGLSRSCKMSIGDQVLLKLTPQIWKKISSKSVHCGLIPKYDDPLSTGAAGMHIRALDGVGMVRHSDTKSGSRAVGVLGCGVRGQACRARHMGYYE